MYYFDTDISERYYFFMNIAKSRSCALSLTVLAITCGLCAGSYRVGDTPIDLPSPEGFSPISTASPELFSDVARLLPANVRLIEHYLKPDELALYRNSTPNLSSQWITISVFRELENKTSTRDTFDSVRTDVRKQLEPYRHDPSVILKDLSLDLQGKTEDFMQRHGGMIVLGVPTDTDTRITFDMLGIYRAEVNDEPVHYIAAGTSSQFLVVGKAIIVNVYGLYRDIKDIEWTHSMSESFIRQIIDANRLTNPHSLLETE